MWRKLIDFFNRMFSNNSRTKDTLTDEEVEKEIKKKEHNLQLLHEIIGSNPLKQIDWIIENGFVKFGELYNSYEDGSIADQRANEITLSYKNMGYTVRDLTEAMGLIFSKKSEEERVEYRSNCCGTLVFKGKSGETYRWNSGGKTAVRVSDIDSNFNKVSQYLERVDDFYIGLETASLFHDYGSYKGSEEVKIGNRIDKINSDIQDLEKTLIFQQNLRGMLSPKDYRMFSPANETKMIANKIKTLEEEKKILTATKTAIGIKGGLSNKSLLIENGRSVYSDIFS